MFRRRRRYKEKKMGVLQGGVSAVLVYGLVRKPLNWGYHLGLDYTQQQGLPVFSWLLNVCVVVNIFWKIASKYLSTRGWGLIGMIFQ